MYPFQVPFVTGSMAFIGENLCSSLLVVSDQYLIFDPCTTPRSYFDYRYTAFKIQSTTTTSAFNISNMTNATVNYTWILSLHIVLACMWQCVPCLFVFVSRMSLCSRARPISDRHRSQLIYISTIITIMKKQTRFSACLNTPSSTCPLIRTQKSTSASLLTPYRSQLCFLSFPAPFSGTHRCPYSTAHMRYGGRWLGQYFTCSTRCLSSVPAR